MTEYFNVNYEPNSTTYPSGTYDWMRVLAGATGNKMGDLALTRKPLSGEMNQCAHLYNFDTTGFVNPTNEAGGVFTGILVDPAFSIGLQSASNADGRNVLRPIIGSGASYPLEFDFTEQFADSSDRLLDMGLECDLHISGSCATDGQDLTLQVKCVYADDVETDFVGKWVKTIRNGETEFDCSFKFMLPRCTNGQPSNGKVIQIRHLFFTSGDTSQQNITVQSVSCSLRVVEPQVQTLASP